MENVKLLTSEIKERLASFFEMCLSQEAIPIDLLEEKLAWAEPFQLLERGDATSLLTGTVSDLFHRVFQTHETPNQYLTDSRFYWAGQIYATIFLEEGASLYHISLLLPLREMKDLFLPYHEMDNAQIVQLYRKREKEKSVLEILKKKSGLSYVEIVKKTEIPKTTLFRLKDNKYLQRIGLDEANRLSQIFHCPITVFLSQVLLSSFSKSSR